METNHVNAEMSKTELIKLLHRMEVSLGEMWPIAERVVKLEKEDEEKYKIEPAEYEQKLKIERKITNITLVAFAVISVVFLTFMSVIGLIVGIVVATWWKRSRNDELKEYIERRSKHQAELAEARKELEEWRKRCDDDIALMPYFCPKGCYNGPQYMRKYVSFFEEGRADTIKEARNLFDEWMHRKRMEQKADAQYAATQEAIAAANAARVAADSAATTASQAKASADRAAYTSYFKQ